MKNNPARALPARRTVGSIVRQSPQKQDRGQSLNNETTATNSVKTNINSNDARNNVDPVCDICAQNVPGPEREKIYALGKCDHPVCYVCSARLRAICDQQECPICREKLDDVIFTANKSKSYDTYDLQSYQHDEEHRIYFETEKTRAAFEKLLSIECLECLKRSEQLTTASKDGDKKELGQTDVKKQDTNCTNSTPTSANASRAHSIQFPNVQKLRRHLDSMHKLKLCGLCLSHNKLFPFEFSYYDYESLKNHIQMGEPNTSHTGHPRCKLCNDIFFNQDELLQHMSREHFHCHLCGRHNTTQHIYFVDYPSLRNHFKTKHYLCERDNCRHEQFTSAFDTQVDYQLHLVQVHDTSTNLSRGEARQHRTITLESTSHRQVSRAHRDAVPANAAVVTTGILATANSPGRQIPESLRAQILQQRLPSRADFPALGNATSGNTSQQNSGAQLLSDQAGPSSSGISFVRSMGGRGKPPEQLDDTDFPPLPEQTKKNKPNSKAKGSGAKPKLSSRPEEMSLEQLISSRLALSAMNNRGNSSKTNKTNKSAKHKPIKIQL